MGDSIATRPASGSAAFAPPAAGAAAAAFSADRPKNRLRSLKNYGFRRLRLRDTAIYPSLCGAGWVCPVRDHRHPFPLQQGLPATAPGLLQGKRFAPIRNKLYVPQPIGKKYLVNASTNQKQAFYAQPIRIG